MDRFWRVVAMCVVVLIVVDGKQTPAAASIPEGKAAMALEHYKTALSHFRKSLTVKKSDSPPLTLLQRCGVLIDSSLCLKQLLREQERERTLKAAISVCRKSGNDEVYFDARWLYSDSARRQGDLALACKLQEELLASEQERCKDKQEGHTRNFCMHRHVFRVRLDLVQDLRTLGDYRAATRHLAALDRDNELRADLMPSMSLHEQAAVAKWRLHLTQYRPRVTQYWRNAEYQDTHSLRLLRPREPKSNSVWTPSEAFSSSRLMNLDSPPLLPYMAMNLDSPPLLPYMDV